MIAGLSLTRASKSGPWTVFKELHCGFISFDLWRLGLRGDVYLELACISGLSQVSFQAAYNLSKFATVGGKA